MRKISSIVVLGFFFTLAVSENLLAAGKEPYKVGAVFSVTGRASFLGDPQEKTVRMIEEGVNKEGGINGHPLKVIVYDDEGKETNTLLAVKRLIDKDQVCVILGPSLTGTTLAVIPVATEKKVPLLSCCGSEKANTPVKERYWIFKPTVGDIQCVSALYDHMKKHGISKIAIVTVTTGYGASGREELSRQAPQYGIKIVADEKYGPKDQDMTPQITKIRGTEAQAIVNWSIGPTQIIIMKNYKQLGLKTPFYQSFGFANKRNITEAEGAAEGVYSPLEKVLVAEKIPGSDPQKPVLIKYKTMYEERYKEPVSVFGGHAWDTLYLAIDALKAVGCDRAKIRDYIENKKNYVGNDGVFNFSPTEHGGALTKDHLIMLKVVNGEFELTD